MTILLFWFALQFTGLALWLTLQGAFALWGSVRLRVQGQQASGQVVRIVSQLHPGQPPSGCSPGRATPVLRWRRLGPSPGSI